MDDWGTSVWDTSEPTDHKTTFDGLSLSPFPAPSEPAVSRVPPFDENSDFGEVVQPVGDDDFGDDFGDFDDGENMVFDESDLGGFTFAPPPLATWEPLRLDPFPSPGELAEQVQSVLSNVWPLSDAEELMTSEDIRQVEGANQVLVTPGSRSLYQTLFNVTPAAVTRPPNWTRSRIRRQHLISLGIPVNLDEVMPQVNGRPMPALNITTRPSSAPPGPRPTHSNPPSGSNTRAGTPRPSTPQASNPRGQSPSRLGPKPKLDEAKISDMLELTPDTLSLLPLPSLELHLNALQALTTDTSTLLTYLLQTREALQQDSETYNGLIAELVSEAQKMKTNLRTKTGAGRRGSGM
ncbi:hypothetical protein BU17DRAFT_73085 [Hysterangium stoloniferum]|nr:hypothetical protein BU17DRAFT_73085 [Hysterangium stoloniferum]